MKDAWSYEHLSLLPYPPSPPCSGKFGSKAKIQPLLCCASMGGDGDDAVVSGAADGGLLLWRASSCVAVRAGAHTGACYSVHSLQVSGWGGDEARCLHPLP